MCSHTQDDKDVSIPKFTFACLNPGEVEVDPGVRYAQGSSARWNLAPFVIVCYYVSVGERRSIYFTRPFSCLARVPKSVIPVLLPWLSSLIYFLCALGDHAGDYARGALRGVDAHGEGEDSRCREGGDCWLRRCMIMR